MKRTWVFDKDGKSREITRKPEANKSAYVQPDFEEWGGKRKWREHLKRTGAMELGHSDVKVATEKWNKRKAAFAEKLAKAPKEVHPVDAPVLDAPDYQRTRLNAEVRNRLEGRPEPSRIELIKITMEQARDLARRR